MPIKEAASKALRQAKKKTLKNKLIKDNLDFLVRRSQKLIKSKKAKEAQEFTFKAIKALDKAAQKTVIKKNTAARKISRLMKKLNALLKAK
jgi:small subunit ribosomal protein S20